MKLSDSLSLNIFILRIAGFYPLDSNKCTKIQRMYSFIPLSLYVLIHVAEQMYIFKNWNDIDLVIYMMPMLLIQVISFIKIAIYWINSDRIQGLLNQLDAKDWNCDNKHSLSLMRLIPLGSKIFAMLPTAVAVLWYLLPYMNNHGEFKFALKASLPAFAKVSPGKHFAHFFEIFMMGLDGIADIVINSTICGFMAHAHAQLKVLKCSLENIGRNTSKSNQLYAKKEESELNNAMESNNKCFRMKRQLIHCIKHHDTILRYIKEIEAIFTWIVFMQFASSAALICFSTIQITIANKGYIEFLYSIIFTMGMISELAIFCYFGNNIMIESLRLSEAIYHCEWMSNDISFRRYMLIFMERTNKPIIILAGKLFPLSLESFVNVLKTSYSYYAVLKGFSSK